MLKPYLAKLATCMIATFMWAGEAAASCLSVNGYMWENRCGVGIDFEWTDQGSCRGWSCSGYVAPYGSNAWGGPEGRYEWVECKSPGGKGDVVAMCNSSGNCACKD